MRLLEITSRQSAHLAAHGLPGLAGVGAALLLGAIGFGSGCLYAGLTPAPVSPVVLAAATATAPTPASKPETARNDSITSIAGIGGPEDYTVGAPTDASLQLQNATPGRVLPASFPPLPARTAAFGLKLVMTRPVVGGWVSSHYGQRVDPFSGRPAEHRGLDFAGSVNSSILAVAPGIVTWSGRQRGYGNLIEIDHGNGWVTRYGHNASNLVAPGDYVKPGQTIALMGATGRATGTHLHFEVLYRGRHQNPARFIPRSA